MLTRRQFLKSGCTITAASGATVLFGRAQAKSPSKEPDYRALVCIALGGGADSFNMLVPADTRAYQVYAKRRGNLALNREQLLPLHGGDSQGRSYGLHYGMQEIQELYGSGDIALLANAGPLQGPVNGSGKVRTPDLSHSGLISRWHQGVDNQRHQTGWAGRVADVLGDEGWQDQLPTNISVSGRNVMQIGACSAAVSLQSGRYQQRTNLSAGVNFSYFNEQMAERVIRSGRPTSVRYKTRLLEKVETECKPIIETAIADSHDFKTRFMPDPFSADLERVARMIAARSRLGSSRQIFFVQFDGWDQHHQLLNDQAILLPELSRGLAAFRDALIEHDVFDDVTTFTMSEFGRSLESNHGGSDHGWGGHHIVMGGGVQGGRIFGDYPHLARGGPLDIGGGSFVPTTSMDEYLAELVLWLGTPVSDLPYILPDISKHWSVNSRLPPLGIFA